MSTIRKTLPGFGAALLLPTCLAIPIALRAEPFADSAQVNLLLADVKTEAVLLKSDSAQLVLFAKSSLGWQSHAYQIEQIKTHINNGGKLLAQLKALDKEASPWQHTAIQRVGVLVEGAR